MSVGHSPHFPLSKPTDEKARAPSITRRLLLGAAALPALLPAASAFAASPTRSWGVDLQNLSPKIAPGDEFFAYVNAGWLARTERPVGYSSYGELNAMFLRTEGRIRRIIDAAAEGGGDRRLADLYRSYTDLAAIERAGLTPIRADLDAILAIRDHLGVARRMAHPMSHAIVGTYIFKDAANTRRSLVHLDQQTLGARVLGLQGRAYYDSADGDFPAIREAYRAYVAETLTRAGVAEGPRRAADILALEGRLAAVQWNAEQLRDRRLNYHLMTLAELQAYAPGFPWPEFIATAGLPPVQEIVLNTDTAIQASARIFADTSVDAWRSYLLFHWIQNHASLLPAAFQGASFDFYGRRIGKQQTQRGRDVRGVQFVNQNLPDLVGRAYVKDNFRLAARAAIEDMARCLKRAFRTRLAAADWLDPATRATALAKIDRMGLRLGYPDDLRDYAEVAIRPDDPIGNVHRLKAAQTALDVQYLSHPEKPYRWHLAPQAVDGSYSPQLNAVTFPAGILQAPAFDPAADPAVNFGAIGAVLGHEMGHGFDDQGSRFDDEGNLRDWWTPASRTAFDARTETLVAQYSGYEPLPGAHLDGRRSLGENLADLAGVTLALDAYRLYAADHGLDTRARLDGFTGEQRFFLGWGQLWRTLETEDALRADIDQGYHSPARYRVNGVVRNLDAWYAAFDVKPGHALFLAPDQRARIW